MNASALTLLVELQTLEVELHQPVARSSPDRLNALLHVDFLEFGSSGQRYSKSDIIDKLPSEVSAFNISADNFELRMLAPDIALLTYSSSNVLASGAKEKSTLRTSIWQLTGHVWQMRFHQGTPAK